MPLRHFILGVSAALSVGIGAFGVTIDRWQVGVGAAVGAIFLLTLLINKICKAGSKSGVPFVSGTVFALLAAFSVLMIYWFPIRDLPAPSGQYAVGVRDFELADDARARACFWTGRKSLVAYLCASGIRREMSRG